ncbi:protein of unknown function [Nitrospira defluvii]|uniref:Uncharacterized protein n=1 Tax=Nitrospira defluvii TaxID=330214 RepID=D8PBK1_9BACT|nr:protein of unknown function [Nitrospira defluvii]
MAAPAHPPRNSKRLHELPKSLRTLLRFFSARYNFLAMIPNTWRDLRQVLEVDRHETTTP